MAMVLVHPLSTVSASLTEQSLRISANARTAELRGPGVHHRSDDGHDDYDMDMDHHRAQGLSQLARALGGRVIFLGDGTELSNEAGDTEMYDHDDEDKDLEEQISRGKVLGEVSEGESQAEREGTPAPTGAPAAESAPASSTETAAVPSTGGPDNKTAS